MSEPSAAHRLRLDGDEWEFEHPDDCEKVDLGGYWDYDCLLGRIVRYEGFDTSDVSPGEYTAKAWAYQSTDRSTFGEWQSGIDLEATA